MGTAGMTEAERRNYIGASDWAYVMNEPPYGCQRMLWYKKRGTEPDRVDSRSVALLERGHKLEPLIIQAYTEKTGRRIHKGGDLLVHPEYDYIALHLDGKIARHVYGGTPGALECKTMGEFPFRQAKRKGLPNGYILQVQGALAVTGWAWGAFAVFWPDGWELETWDFQRDDELIDLLLQAGESFWKKVLNGPAPDQLGNEDSRCKKCLWRATCWNLSLEEIEKDKPPAEKDEAIPVDESFLPLVTDLRDAQAIADDATETVDAIKEQIRQQMGERDAVRGSGYRIYYRETKPGAKFDRKGLEKEFPAIAKQFTLPGSTSRPLKIYDMPV